MSVYKVTMSVCLHIKIKTTVDVFANIGQCYYREPIATDNGRKPCQGLKNHTLYYIPEYKFLLSILAKPSNMIYDPVTLTRISSLISYVIKLVGYTSRYEDQ